MGTHCVRLAVAAGLSSCIIQDTHRCAGPPSQLLNWERYTRVFLNRISLGSGMDMVKEQVQTFVRTTSLRLELSRVASLRRAPESTFPDRFFPVKSHIRRSKILSDTAFACKAHRPHTEYLESHAV